MNGNRSYKNEKVFKKADIIVYAVIVLILAAISLAVFLPQKDSSAIKSFSVYYGDSIIYSYSFGTHSGKVTEAGKGKVTVCATEETTLVYVSTDLGHNVIEIGADYVKMSEADCSERPDCVELFSPLTEKNGAIICLPHKLRIVADQKPDDEVRL